MTQTITVVFTTHTLEQIVAQSMKKYIFNYSGFLDLHIGDIITDNRYDRPMQIVAITPGATFKTPMGHEVKYLMISKWITKSVRFSKKSEVESRTFTLDINTARQWYNGKDTSLKNIALQVYSECELQETAEFILSQIKTSSVCINIPDEVLSSKYLVLAELEAYAKYFNSKSPEQTYRFFIGDNPRCNPINECVYAHSTVYYPGVIYFNRKEDLIKTIKFMGDKLTHLF